MALVGFRLLFRDDVFRRFSSLLEIMAWPGSEPLFGGNPAHPVFRITRNARLTRKDTAEQLEGAALSVQLARAFGLRVRRARIDAGLTPKDIEAKTKVSRALLRQIEAGLDNPTLDTLAALARMVGMSVSELLALKE